MGLNLHLVNLTQEFDTDFYEALYNFRSTFGDVDSLTIWESEGIWFAADVEYPEDLTLMFVPPLEAGVRLNVGNRIINIDSVELVQTDDHLLWSIAYSSSYPASV